MFSLALFPLLLLQDEDEEYTPGLEAGARQRGAAAAAADIIEISDDDEDEEYTVDGGEEEEDDWEMYDSEEGEGAQQQRQQQKGKKAAAAPRKPTRGRGSGGASDKAASGTVSAKPPRAGSAAKAPRGRQKAGGRGGGGAAAAAAPTVSATSLPACLPPCWPERLHPPLHISIDALPGKPHFRALLTTLPTKLACPLLPVALPQGGRRRARSEQADEEEDIDLEEEFISDDDPDDTYQLGGGDEQYKDFSDLQLKPDHFNRCAGAGGRPGRQAGRCGCACGRGRGSWRPMGGWYVTRFNRRTKLPALFPGGVPAPSPRCMHEPTPPRTVRPHVPPPHCMQAAVGVPRRPHLPGDLLSRLQAGL